MQHYSGQLCQDLAFEEFRGWSRKALSTFCCYFGAEPRCASNKYIADVLALVSLKTWSSKQFRAIHASIRSKACMYGGIYMMVLSWLICLILCAYVVIHTHTHNTHSLSLSFLHSCVFLPKIVPDRTHELEPSGSLDGRQVACLTSSGWILGLLPHNFLP